MADFCYECTAEVFGEEFAERNDMRGLAETGKVRVLCEGCGWTEVDVAGHCLFGNGGANHLHEFAFVWDD